MKPAPQQVTAFRDALNRCMFLFENGQFRSAIGALDALAEAVEEIDVKAKLAAVSKPPEPESGAWQEERGIAP